MKKMVAFFTLVISALVVPLIGMASAGNYSWTASICKPYVAVYDEPAYNSVYFYNWQSGAQTHVYGTALNVYWGWNRECGKLGVSIDNGGWRNIGGVWHWIQVFEYGHIDFVQNPGRTDGGWYVCLNGNNYCSFEGYG